MTTRMALFDDAPADAVAPIVTRQRVRTKRRRRRHQATTLPIPPCPGPRAAEELTDMERQWMESKTVWLLALHWLENRGRYGDKQPQWMKYAPLEKDDQIGILYTHMVRMVARGKYDPHKAQFSTLCYSSAFPNILKRHRDMAMHYGKHYSQFRDDDSGTYGAEMVEDYRDIPTPERVETCEAVRRAVNSLPSRQRSVIKRLYGMTKSGRAMSRAEIAERLNLPVDKVSKLARRAMETLQAKMEAMA
jgi:RNA polymerase sigma factor (sigma-70 family)